MIEALKARILNIITTGEQVSDAEFSELTTELLAYQREQSSFLDRFFSGFAVSTAKRWKEIPGLPTSAFKRTAVRAFPEEQTLTYFQTSGTTEGESGRHYFQSLEFYEAAIIPNFRSHLLPDADRLPMLILTPPPAESPHSSLVHMMEVVRKKCGTDDSDYYLRDGTLQYVDLLTKAQQFAARSEPVFLLGTAFAFIYLVDALAENGFRLQLPAGSRIMETGGFKGRTREVLRPEFYAVLSEATGIPSHMIVNEYGMTELSSQFYDVSIVENAASSWKSIPPWTRVACVQPMTNLPVPDGEPGLIRIYDLANIGSCCVLQTEDVGVMREGQFEVHGRVGMASPRGCSLAAEDALRRTAQLNNR